MIHPDGSREWVPMSAIVVSKGMLCLCLCGCMFSFLSRVFILFGLFYNAVVGFESRRNSRNENIPSWTCLGV